MQRDSSLTLFDDQDREDLGRASRLEPEFDWWNRSARSEATRIPRNSVKAL
jgi:hypothetical protein